MADVEAPTSPLEVPAPQAAHDPMDVSEKPTTNGESSAVNENGDVATEHEKVADTAATGETATKPEDASVDPADSTATSGSKDKKRKSAGGGVPEHKSKKLNKKKSMPTLRLDCKPGDLYWARLKGYPPWPAVICDEEMLPELLLATRPVSTARPDGSVRDDFEEGGKNAKERTFPIMFLSTNEFQWMVNTSLTPLDPEECQTLPKTKMTKALQDAYRIASESPPLDYFKSLLRTWQQEEEAYRKAEEEAIAEMERAAAERDARGPDELIVDKSQQKKPKKKAPRKSKAGDEDTDMDGAPSSTKKRKKDAESDADGVKPKKTPKVTKLNAPKTPNGEAASKKSTSKPKKKVVQAPKVEDEDDSKPQMSEAEKLAQREKAVLYLRHRLQKGFLSRDQAPQESEMAGMAEFFAQLEAYENLEPSIIRATKIHKVLKAIVKLASVPKDDEYNFKKRSSAMLEVWNKRMEADGDAPAPPSAVEEKATAPTSTQSATNGGQENTNEQSTDAAAEPKDAEMKDLTVEEAKEEASKESEEQMREKAEDNADKIVEKVEDKAEGITEPPEAPVESTADLGNDAKDEKDEVDVDVAMATA